MVVPMIVVMAVTLVVMVPMAVIVMMAMTVMVMVFMVMIVVMSVPFVMVLMVVIVVMLVAIVMVLMVVVMLFAAARDAHATPPPVLLPATLRRQGVRLRNCRRRGRDRSRRQWRTPRRSRGSAPGPVSVR